MAAVEEERGRDAPVTHEIRQRETEGCVWCVLVVKLLPHILVVERVIGEQLSPVAV